MYLLAETGRNIGDDAAMLQGDGAAVEAAHQFMLVGDDKHRDAHLADAFQQFHHLKAHLGVDVAGGLVRNDEAGAVGQTAGHGPALLLTVRSAPLLSVPEVAPST